MNAEERAKYLNRPECGKGWNGIIRFTDLLLASIDPDYTIEQIKEKFGGLRYYASNTLQDQEASDRFWSIIRTAERLSYRICEICGDNGELRKEGWYQTLCDKCYADKCGEKL